MKKINLYDFTVKLKRHRQKLFSPQEIQNITKTSKRAVGGFISYHQKKGNIIKYRNGLYSLSDNEPNTYEIANKLYQPSYISLESALNYYSIIPEIPYEITSITPKATRKFTVNGMIYSYAKIKQPAYMSYQTINYLGTLILIATPEKALADFLYYMFLKKRNWNDRLDLQKINISILKNNLLAYHNDKILKFVKNYISNL